MNNIDVQAEKMVQAVMPELKQIAASLRQGSNTEAGNDRLAQTLLSRLPHAGSVQEAFALGYVTSLKIDLKLAELVGDA